MSSILDYIKRVRQDVCFQQISALNTNHCS